MKLTLSRAIGSLIMLIVMGTSAWVIAQEPAQSEEPALKSEKAESDDPATVAEEDNNEDEKSDDADSDESKAKADSDNEDDESEDAKEEDKDGSISISGHFSAEKMEVVTLRPKSWTSFSVVQAVEHGTEIKKGDTLIEFDSRSINESIADLEAKIALSELALMESEHKLNLLKKTIPMRLDNIERSERIATENLKRFLTQKRAARKKSLVRSVTNAENWLSYQQEELDQLEKMYEADDLTEETEEIILLRTRHEVERAQYSLERTRQSTEESLTVDLPRQEETLEEAVRKTSLALEEAKLTLPPELEEETHKLGNRRITHDRLVARLARLKTDQELMSLAAPISGVVYYGKPNHGKWSSPSSLASVLRPGGTVKPNQTILTVVKLAPIEIQALVEEKNLPHVQVGTTGTVTPTAYPKSEFEATIESVSNVPAGGKFSVTLELGDVPAEVNLVPGMSCKVEFEKESNGESAEESDDE